MPHGDGRPAGDPPRAAPSRQYGIAWVVVMGCLVALVFHRLRGPVPGGGIAERNAHRIVTRIDPNTASAAELAALPGIGPTTAAKIIAYRESQRGTGGPQGPAFRRAEDLAQVQGIGPKKVEELRPLLRFPVTRDGAGESSDSPGGS